MALAFFSIDIRQFFIPKIMTENRDELPPVRQSPIEPNPGQQHNNRMPPERVDSEKYGAGANFHSTPSLFKHRRRMLACRYVNTSDVLWESLISRCQRR